MSVTYERTEEQIEIDAIVLARVKAGIEFLQKEHGEDWVDKIDLRKLNLKHGACCVLGQVYGEYGAACKQLGIELWEGQSVDYGFMVPEYRFARQNEKKWDMLQAAWEQEIAALITGGEDA